MGLPINHDIALTPEETIAAVSTPPGEGGIGIIRLSGLHAIAIACRLFRRANGMQLTAPRAFRQYYGQIIDDATGMPVDEVLLSVMRAPHSYTREDVVEISAHGGPVPLRAILALVCAHGARLAQPGEFTQRAFLNGRIDLTQAEAVLDTIRARTDAGLRAAQQHLHGEIGRRVGALRQQLISLLATLEVAIDYADEDMTFLTPPEIRAELIALQQQVQALSASQRQGRLLREGARTAIIGRPNTGKSSLLNALIGEARAIVTEIPGTTRDVIEEQFDLAGIPLRLQDTAGIRTTDDRIEQLGVARSREAIAQADLILLLIDRAQPFTQEDHALLLEVQDRPLIIILNKADLPAVVTRPDIPSLPIHAPLVELSVVTGEGMHALEEAMRALLLGGTVATESPMLANLRQQEAAEQAAQAITQSIRTVDTGGSEELIAVDLMAAAAALGEITGDTVRDEVIAELFARFCVGK